MHFSLEIFGQFKKKQYLCKLFRPNRANMHAYIIEKAGTFINKNQLNKTTKCLQFNN